MFIERSRIEVCALRQECYVIQETDNVYGAVNTALLTECGGLCAPNL
jgi:hypothetical protein